MNKKVFFLSIVLVLFTCLNISFAKESQIETVTVKGFGESKQEAVQDGLRSALMQIVGTYMSSKTVVQNYDLIEDKILTYSSGFIEGHKVLSTKRDKDLFVAELSVRVKKGKLAKKVKSLNIAKASIDIDTKKITSSIQTTKFNVSNLDELQKTFNEVVVKPILDEESHSVTLKGFNIYEIQGKPKENGSNLTFDLKNIDNGKLKTITINKKYRSNKRYVNGVWDLSDNAIYKLIDNEYFVEIKYVVSLDDDYYQTVKRFLDVAADKKEKGVSVATHNASKKTNIIMLSKLSHIGKRRIYTHVYRFKDRKWQKIKNMGNMALEPYMEFSILDEDELPVRKWRHNFESGGSKGKCNSRQDYTLECARIKWWNGETFHKPSIVWGIKTKSDYKPFTFAYSKKPKELRFLKNDGIEYTTYIFLKKEDAKLIKDIQISIHPNPVKPVMYKY